MEPWPPWRVQQKLPLVTMTMLLLLTTIRVSRSCSEGEQRALLRSIKPLVAAYEFWNEVAGADCCAWEGVGCRHGRVVSLSLAQLGIAGTLDGAVLAPFTELESLDLSLNQITGFSARRHSGFWGLEKLSVLNVSDNRLTDEGVPSLVKNLTTLSELHVAGNHLLSTSWIANMTSLKIVDMSRNSLHEFTGICGLHQLEYIQLDFNMLRGMINPCLGKLHRLTYLSMRANFLTGEIGASLLNNLSQVETIHLVDNNLTGTFVFSSLANNSKLRDIDLSNNHQLEIETELIRWTPLFQLEFLNLSNTMINKRSNGVLPTFLSTQVSLSWIDLSLCSLQGRIPSVLFHNLSDFLLLRSNNMNFLDIGDRLGDNFTSPIWLLDLSDNKIQMQMPNNFGSIFPLLQYLDMSSNRLYGGIPSLEEATSTLQVLDLSLNRLNGEISPALTGNASILTSLLLSHNDLTGPMPPFHWSLGELIHLSLENNRLSGRLSALLPNCTNLKNLNARNNHLSGVIPVGLLRFQKIGAVLLGGNLLHGGIPWDLCLNNYLHFLDLSNNRFSGEIPSCFYNEFSTELPTYYEDDPFNGIVPRQRPTPVEFTTKGESLTYVGGPLELMTGIDFSMNRLSGTIPSPIGFLRKLRSLNLSHNNLVGPIPDTFMYLSDMESLDLSYNHLNGSLPLQLANLSFLNTFNVSYNDLSGEIPFQSQLSTFTKTAFEGNENLCGQVIDKTCPTSSDRDKHGDDGEMLQSSSTDAMETLLLFWSFVAGCFALGFWGVVALLAWNAGCRRRLFALMDACVYKLGWFLVP